MPGSRCGQGEILKKRFVPLEPLGTTNQPPTPLPWAIPSPALLTCLPPQPPNLGKETADRPSQMCWAQRPVSGVVLAGCLGRGQ